ncbi:MAG: S41 family peptidase [Lentisphaeria bacterium]|nr:S41 family peptidase [Lentisphaeria bacterium]
MNRRSLIFSLFALALAVNLLVGYRVYSNDELQNGDAAAFEKIAIMMRVLHLIRQDYVDEDLVDYERLLTNAMHGMVESLDPHSGYMEQDAYDDMMESTEGEFGGLGVLITIRDGALTVIAPMEGGPSARAGILPGDKIVKINGVVMGDKNLSGAVGELRGEPGTLVTITIKRGDKEPFDITIERSIIEVPSVKNARLLADGVGYIRVTQFDEKTAPGMKAALKDLTSQGMTSLILDLRNNPGGLLTSAVDVASFFLPKDALVVSTVGRRASQNKRYETTGGDKYETVPLFILVNGGSASASEIVAGCLRDWRRAVLIGEKTFGKGSVQSVIKLSDGSALRLTTAKYFTPSKVVIHDKGIEPNIEVTMTDEELMDLITRQRNGETGEAVDPEKDKPLAKALEIIQNDTGPRREAGTGAVPAAPPRSVEKATARVDGGETQ